MNRSILICLFAVLLFPACAADLAAPNRFSTRFWASGADGSIRQNDFGSGETVFLHYSILNTSPDLLDWSIGESGIADFTVHSPDNQVLATTVGQLRHPDIDHGRLGSGDSLTAEWPFSTANQSIQPGTYTIEALPRVVVDGATPTRQTISLVVH